MSQYIGARYVPKFMGTYDATQSYENMVVVDNGMGTSYISTKPTPAGTPLTDNEYWAIYGASNGAIINLQNQIDAIDANLNILSGAFCIASSFSGATDAAKLQAAIDYCQTNNIWNLIIDKKFDITGTSLIVNLPETTPNRRVLRLIGTKDGEIYKGDSGYMFTSPNVLSHGLTLINLRISGNKDASLTNRCDVFDCSHIIRITSFNNYITFVRDVFRLYDISSGFSTMQSCRSDQDTIVFSRSIIRQEKGNITDTHLNNGTYESNTNTIFSSREMGINNGILGLYITDCVIEDDQDVAIDVSCVDIASMAVTNTYFEGNVNGHVEMYPDYINGVSFIDCEFHNNGTIGDTFKIKGDVNGFDRLTFIHCYLESPATSKYTFYIDGAYARLYSIALNNCRKVNANLCNVNNFVYETHELIRSLAYHKGVTQMSGDSVTINSAKDKIGKVDAGYIYVGVDLPFIADNANYTITPTLVMLSGVGDITTDVTVNNRNNGGFELKAPVTLGDGLRVFDFINYTITFA